MTDRELLQMALDALNNFDKGNHGMRWQVPVIKALRARLSQPEPWVKTYSGGKPNYTEPIEPEPMIDGWPLWSGLPKPEPEPVAWGIANTRPTETQPLMMVMLDEPEPSHLVVPLYAAREWVGLTNKEYEAMAEKCVTNCYFDTLKYAKAIEAKLKEKNEN
jgi:hypothetical protein